MEPGTYAVQIVHLAGLSVGVDFLEFTSTTPVESRSWGSLKQLFR